MGTSWEEEGAPAGPPFWVKFLVLLGFFAIGFWALYGGVSSVYLPPLEVGQPARDFRLSALDGKPVALSALRGKVVMLNFWATWCEPCKKEMPAMQQLYAAMPRDRFAMLAVSVDKDGEAPVRDFMTRMKLGFPALLDPGEKVARALYDITGVPETFVIDAKGTLVRKVIGPAEWDSPAEMAYFRGLVAKAAN